MKKVTSWAAIIAVPTAITGFYGQNLPYPGFATRLGCVRLHGADLGPVHLAATWSSSEETGSERLREGPTVMTAHLPTLSVWSGRARTAVTEALAQAAAWLGTRRRSTTPSHGAGAWPATRWTCAWNEAGSSR